GFLHQITTCTGAESAFGIEHFVVHRVDENRKLRIHRYEIFDQIQTAAAWKSDVGDDEIRLAPWNVGQRFLRALRSPATEESRLGIDERTHGVAHHRVV